jgi:hypothetical protein
MTSPPAARMAPTVVTPTCLLGMEAVSSSTVLPRALLTDTPASLPAASIVTPAPPAKRSAVQAPPRQTSTSSRSSLVGELMLETVDLWDTKRKPLIHYCLTDRKNKRPFTPSPRPRAPQRPRRRPRLTQSYYVPPGAPRQPHRRAPEQV